MSSAEQDTLCEGILRTPSDMMSPGTGLTLRECALAKYADLLTHSPAAVTQADIAKLRDVGLDDRGIHDACAIVAYFAFVNRIADGLGVQLESTTRMQRQYDGGPWP